MKYTLYKTAKKTAKENNLIPAVSKYYSGNDLFYDFSILDRLNIDPADLDTIKADFMNYHAVSWYDQPLPLLLTTDSFTGYCGEIRTAAHRVYKSNGKRLMIIIEITAAKIEKQCRRDIWSEYKTEATYTARTYSNIEGDYEIA